MPSLLSVFVVCFYVALPLVGVLLFFACLSFHHENQFNEFLVNLNQEVRDLENAYRQTRIDHKKELKRIETERHEAEYRELERKRAEEKRKAEEEIKRKAAARQGK